VKQAAAATSYRLPGRQLQRFIAIRLEICGAFGTEWHF